MAALQPVGPNLWLIDGPLVSFYGFPYPTRMAVVRLASGALWLWSPVRLDDELRREIATLGEPHYAVEPNKLHHLALSQWVGAWPSLRLYAPPGLAQKRSDLHFAEELRDDAPPEWRGEIDQVRVEGSFAMTEVLFFHRASRTCLVGDLIQKHDRRAMSRWQRWVMQTDGLVGANGSTPREWRWSFFDRTRARSAISHALAWAPDRLVIAHGACKMQNGKTELSASLEWLLGRQSRQSINPGVK